jgi:ribonuclease G
MTRQNVTDGPREVMTKKCPTCGGDGIVVSEHTAAVDIERRLRSLVTPGSRDKAFKVEVAAKVANLVVGPGGSRLRELEETTKRRFFLVGQDDEHLDHFRVIEQGTLEKVAPKLPVDVGQELEVKLGEVGLYDPHDGVGKIEDVDIVVGNAAKLVGKKVKVRITAISEGTAWAELTSPVDKPDEPLTAEAEAEKPTRAKRTTASVAVEEPVEEETEGTEAVAEETDGETPAAPKKKTRRGSRGGRNRKKKTGSTAGAMSSNGAEPEVEAEPVADTEPEPATEPVSAGPVIHVPDRELGAEDENGDAPTPAKKRTRRGSRGGKNRRKKTAATSGTVATAEEAPPAEAEAPEPEAPSKNGGDEDWGYTPMSQWGLDDSE